MDQVQPKQTLLVVDDQEIDREILSNILGVDYHVLTAKNGKQALDIVDRKGHILAAILLDIIMPVMDGYEVLQQLHEDEEASEIPVLVMSQENTEESELKALTMGASDFITKPYHASVLKHG